MGLMLLSLHPRLSAVPSTPVYSTDFEHVTKKDANRLNMGIDNWFEFGGDGGASIWMEGLDRNTSGITCHSGNRCLGMELTDITKSRRNQFGIYNLQNLGITDQYFVSEWLYLPGDWRLHLPMGRWNWYELSNPDGAAGPTFGPYTSIHIIQRDPTVDVFELNFDQVDTTGTQTTLKVIPNYALPRGQWVNLQYYVFRHPTNGIVRVWIDGTLLWDGENIATKNPSIADWLTIPAKIYYETSDTFSPYRIWVDDLEISNGEVSTVTSVSLSARLDGFSSPPTVLISGSIYPAPGGPVNVTLEFSNNQGGTYQEIAHVTSAADGTFSYSWKAPGNDVFMIRAEAQGVESSAVSVGVNSVPGFPLESLLLGCVLGLLFAIMRRRQRSSRSGPYSPVDCHN
jgi:hypothetical protein